MGCSCSIRESDKIPLMINEDKIISIIFNIDGGRIKMPAITLPFFRLGNLFLNCLLKNESEKNNKNELRINDYRFFYKNVNISDAFYRNDEFKILGINVMCAEIRVTQNIN